MPAFTAWWDLEGHWPRPALPTLPPAGDLCTSSVVRGPCGAVEGRGREGLLSLPLQWPVHPWPPSLALPMLLDTFFHLSLWSQQVTKPGSSNELDGWGIPVGSRNYQQPKLKVSSGGGRFCSSIFYLLGNTLKWVAQPGSGHHRWRGTVCLTALCPFVFCLSRGVAGDREHSVYTHMHLRSCLSVVLGQLPLNFSPSLLPLTLPVNILSLL